MRTSKEIWICRFLVMGFLLILASNCMEDLSDTVIIINKDQDSISYAIVTIGTQVWMTHNLKVRRYRNVEKIKTTATARLDITSEAAPEYQWAYDGDEKNVDAYGRLYTWYAATDPRHLCPKGWHVPTDEEWSILISLEPMGGKDLGGSKLKESGTSHWIAPNTGATNESGFTALPGGYRFCYGSFSDIGFSGFWWSSSESSDSSAYGWGVAAFNSQVSRLIFNKRDGLSVRCVMDN